MTIRTFTGGGTYDTALVIQAADYRFVQYWTLQSAVDMGWKNNVHVQGFWRTTPFPVTFVNGTSNLYVSPVLTTAVFMTLGSGGHHYSPNSPVTYTDTTPPPQLNIDASSYVQRDMDPRHTQGFWRTTPFPVTHTNGTNVAPFNYPPSDEIDYSPGRVQASTRAGRDFVQVPGFTQVIAQTSYLLYPRTDVEVDTDAEDPGALATVSFSGTTNTMQLLNSRSIQQNKRLLGFDLRGASFGPQSRQLYPRGSKPLFTL